MLGHAMFRAPETGASASSQPEQPSTGGHLSDHQIQFDPEAVLGDREIQGGPRRPSFVTVEHGRFVDSQRYCLSGRA